MEDDLCERHPDNGVLQNEFEPASFAVELELPDGDQQLLTDAATAVRQEYRDSSRWKRLRCRQVSLIAERDRGSVCVLYLGSRVEFDWTWEGAVAFRPRFLDDSETYSDFSYESAAYEDQILWSGEVLEVDERSGCLLISLDDPEAIPTTGSFFVRPFEFLAVLDSVFNSPACDDYRQRLPARLAAAAGGIHPAVLGTSRAGLPELQNWWQFSWSVLWGPPGTGKTWTTGQQVAAVLADPDERILIVSTTNRATDAVALAIGNAARSQSRPELADGRLLRIGKGAAWQSFAKLGLQDMLQGTESEVLRQIDHLAEQLRRFETLEDKALTRKQIGQLRAGSRAKSQYQILSDDARVVVTTAFQGLRCLSDPLVTRLVNARQAPFTTIVIDEAGLIPRTTVAALSLLAARRVVLVGDSRQLAPISRISRILPPRQQTWLASSGLSHLDQLQNLPAAVHVLTEQHRMHPEVCRVVSDFQYGGLLQTAPHVRQRKSQTPSLLTDFSRAIWYVLDDDAADLASIRAERGPGNKSWIRNATTRILQQLLTDPELRQASGLFISPYRAQAQIVARLFASWGLSTWEASTVHSQQGWEADVVIFDTVNAGSYNWPGDEWKRLVNVGLSRAREAVVVLASRSEMQEPYLRSLQQSLTAAILVVDDAGLKWQRVQATGPVRRDTAKAGVAEARSEYGTAATSSGRLGDQIAARRQLQPVLSQEQQRLSNLNLDGKPRLVRGVAGSGKSVVLCHWLAKTVQRLQDQPDTRIWAVYANRSLHQLLQQSVESSWHSLHDGDLFQPREFPWQQVSLLHVKDVLAGMLPDVRLSMQDFEFDYDRAAQEFLNRCDAAELQPRCCALFIDEAQDMGPATLKLLLSLVEQTDTQDRNSRAAHIFYDNAQNIYGRRTPRWADFGLDLRGRSTIMRESFRSTVPIAELATNILHRLTDPAERQDQKELLRLGLLENCERNGQKWLRVRFSETDGPRPIFHEFDSRDDEIDAVARHLKYLIGSEEVAANDICLIYNGKPAVQLLETRLQPMLSELGVELSVQTNRPYQRRSNTLVVTTSHSFKGYEADVVMIPCADQFVTADGRILAHNLYVAMTRARSLLAMYGTRTDSAAATRVIDTIADCVRTLNATPAVDTADSIQDDLNTILDQIGPQHRGWLVDLWKRFQIQQEPVTDAAGNVLAQPLFWFRHQDQILACFHSAAAADPSGRNPALPYQSIQQIQILQPGEFV